MKAKSLIVSLILIVCFAGIGIGLYCAWPAITGTITDSKYYTSEDLQDAYDKGYDDAFKNKDELTQQVDYYKELTDTYYISILDYQAQIKDFEDLNNTNEETIKNLTEQKNNLLNNIESLEEIKKQNENSINNLNSQISDLNSDIEKLNAEIVSLKNSGLNKDLEITNLNNQISSLNTQISNLTTLKNQLQSSNNSHVNTITLLNQQIVSLNSQISNLTSQIQNNSNIVTSLNSKISELEKSIEYYETFISSLESGDKVIATFEYDGSVYNIQVVTKGSNLSVVTPVNTEYKIFNYWTVNGEQIDLSTYSITESTKFVASITYKFDIKFIVDNEEYDSQIIVKNGFATLPEEPTKAGYEFSGWSLNGIDIIDNISTIPITQNIAYIAVFTKLHTVTFMNGDNIYETQYVKNGNFATNVIIENEGNKIFKGWKVNDILVDISTYQILSDTIFVADFAIAKTVEFYLTYSSFSPEQNVLYETKYVEENNFVELPTPPEKEGYVFKGWCDATVLFGETIIDLSNYPITADMKLRPAWEQYKTLKFYVGEELFHSVQVLDGDYIEPFESPVNSTNLNADWIYFNSVFMGASTKKIFDFNEPVNTSLYEYDMLDMSYKFYWHTYETLEDIHLSSENNVITYSNENFNKEILNDYGILDMSIDFTYTINGNIISRSYNFGLNTELCYDTRNEYKLTDLLVHNSYVLYLVITFNTDGEIVFTLNYSGASQPVFTSLTINNFTYIVE